MHCTVDRSILWIAESRENRVVVQLPVSAARPKDPVWLADRSVIVVRSTELMRHTLARSATAQSSLTLDLGPFRLSWP